MGLAKDYKLQQEIDQQNRDSAINRAMAEVAGWTEVTTTSIQEHRLKTWSAVLVGRPPCSISNQDRVPNFLLDLNAVHEVIGYCRQNYTDMDKEPFWCDGQYSVEMHSVCNVNHWDSSLPLIDATARQRCTAILKTLNRWNPEWDLLP
jgi:hypothetical protein